MKILIMGLPGSGKTWFAERLAAAIDDCAWYNADEIRTGANDWDFSPDGRQRQSARMRNVADFEDDQGRNVICDFVCPTRKLREDFSPDITIWMNTIEEGRFEDTNKMFEPALDADYIIDSHWLDEGVKALGKTLVERYSDFDPLMPTVQMLGRWQPWHDGHTELFRRAWAITGQVAIMVRLVPTDVEANERVPGQNDNPFDEATVRRNIIEALSNQGFTINREYVIMIVPNIVDISYGRGVGYTFTEHDLGANIHNISATKIRQRMRDEGTL